MYRQFPAALGLRPYVAGYWFLKGRMSAAGLTAWLPTDLCADIIIKLGDSYTRQVAGGARPEVVRFSNVDAQRSHAVTFVQQGCAKVIGIRFVPGGLAAFLPLPMALISEQVLALNDLFGAEAKLLEERLDAAASAAACVALIDDFLLAHLTTAVGQQQQLLRQMGCLLLEGYKLPEVAWQLGVSERSIRRYSQAVLGVSPKRYARVLRFQQVMAALERAPELGWDELIFRCGYYDQAHLIKEFQTFAGVTPEVYRQRLADRFLQDSLAPIA